MAPEGLTAPADLAIFIADELETNQFVEQASFHRVRKKGPRRARVSKRMLMLLSPLADRAAAPFGAALSGGIHESLDCGVFSGIAMYHVEVSGLAMLIGTVPRVGANRNA